MTIGIYEIAVLAYFVSLAMTAWWWTAAGREWQRHVVARGGLPDFAAGGMAERAEHGGVGNQLRLIVHSITIGRRVREMAGRVDPDPDTEAWRVRGYRRLHLLAIVALTGWSLPLVAVVIPAFVDGLPPVSDALRLLFFVGATALFGSIVFRFVRIAMAYGNGAPISLREVIISAVGLPSSLAILAVLTLIGA